MDERTTQERWEKFILHRDTIIQEANLKGAEIPLNADYPEIILGLQRITLGLPEAEVESLLDDILGEVVVGDYSTKGQAILDEKEAIRQAIIAKDVDVPVETPLSQFPAKIAAIETGGGGVPQNIIKATYIDYDGTVLKEEYGAVGFTPTPPADPAGDDIRIFSEWMGIQENLQEDTVIGASYWFGSDLNTHLFISVLSDADLTVSIRVTIWTGRAVIRWGDGQDSATTGTGNIVLAHTYSSYGEYRIDVEELHLSVRNKLGGSFNPCIDPLKVLTKVYIGWSTVLGFYAFYGGSGLKYADRLRSVCLSSVDSMPSADSRLQGLYYCKSIKALVVPSSFLPYDFGHQYLTGLKYYIFPAIAQGGTGSPSIAFKGFNSLNYVIFPPDVSSLDNFGFTECADLNKYKIPANIISLSGQAFSSTSIEEIELPETVINGTLPSSTTGMFEKSRNLRKIDIKATFSSILDTRFIYECYNLEALIFRQENPPTIDSTSGLTPRTHRSAVLKIYVPDLSVEAYKTAGGGWSFYTDIIYPLSQLPA